MHIVCIHKQTLLSSEYICDSDRFEAVGDYRLNILIIVLALILLAAIKDELRACFNSGYNRIYNGRQEAEHGVEFTTYQSA